MPATIFQRQTVFAGDNTDANRAACKRDRTPWAKGPPPQQVLDFENIRSGIEKYGTQGQEISEALNQHLVECHEFKEIRHPHQDRGCSSPTAHPQQWATPETRTVCWVLSRACCRLACQKIPESLPVDGAPHHKRLVFFPCVSRDRKNLDLFRKYSNSSGSQSPQLTSTRAGVQRVHTCIDELVINIQKYFSILLGNDSGYSHSNLLRSSN